MLLGQAVRAASVNRETGVNIRSPPFRSTGIAGTACVPQGATHEQWQQPNIAARRTRPEQARGGSGTHPAISKDQVCDEHAFRFLPGKRSIMALCDRYMTRGADPMSTIYDPQISAGSGQTQPYWPGPGGPAGYGEGPGGYGGGPAGPGGPVRRFRRRLLLAGTAVVVGLVTFFGLQATGFTSGGRALTTPQIAAQVDPGLVDVVSTLGFQQAEAAGTGLVLTSSGEVLTNNHVIEGATAIKVTDVGNGRSYQAKVVGYNRSHDIAVLQLQNASGLTTVTLGNSSTAAAGQKVVALGNAGGKGGIPSVAAGRITGLGASITASDAGAGTSEQLTGLIHHNADIQPGDSGGPLVNTAGQVIGIDTAASSGFQFQSGQAKTQAFAIPVNEAVSIARQITAGTSSSTVHIGTTGFLGVEISSAANAAADGVPAGSGAAVAGLVSGSPAGRAGIAAGDVIVSVDGHPVSSPSALQSALELRHPGDSVRIGWTDQAGQAQSATVVLANGPAA
jgi:S1-C subfamily serine protease